MVIDFSIYLGWLYIYISNSSNRPSSFPAWTKQCKHMPLLQTPWRCLPSLMHKCHQSCLCCVRPWIPSLTCCCFCINSLSRACWPAMLCEKTRQGQESNIHGKVDHRESGLCPCPYTSKTLIAWSVTSVDFWNMPSKASKPWWQARVTIKDCAISLRTRHEVSIFNPWPCSQTKCNTNCRELDRVSQKRKQEKTIQSIHTVPKFHVKRMVAFSKKASEENLKCVMKVFLVLRSINYSSTVVEMPLKWHESMTWKNQCTNDWSKPVHERMQERKKDRKKERKKQNNEKKTWKWKRKINKGRKKEKKKKKEESKRQREESETESEKESEKERKKERKKK